MKINPFLYIASVIWMAIFISIFTPLTLSADYLPHTQGEDLEFSITSNFATECILKNINTPYGLVFINLVNNSSGVFSFNVKGGNYSMVGTYCHNIICTDGTETMTGAECRDVSFTGENFNETQFSIIIALGILIFLFGGLGFSFSKEKWKIRGFFFVLAMLIAILMLNSIRVFAGTSKTLYNMVSSGIIMGIVAIVFMVFYLLIMYTIELFKTIKNKRNLKWEVSNEFN